MLYVFVQNNNITLLNCVEQYNNNSRKKNLFIYYIMIISLQISKFGYYICSPAIDVILLRKTIIFCTKINNSYIIMKFPIKK